MQRLKSKRGPRQRWFGIVFADGRGGDLQVAFGDEAEELLALVVCERLVLRDASSRRSASHVHAPCGRGSVWRKLHEVVERLVIERQFVVGEMP